MEGWDSGDNRTFSFRSWLEGRSKQLPAPRAGGEDTDVVHPPWPQPREGLQATTTEAKWHFDAQSLPWLPTTGSSLGGAHAGELAGTTSLPHHLLVERRDANILVQCLASPRGVLGQGPSSSREQGTQR